MAGAPHTRARENEVGCEAHSTKDGEARRELAGGGHLRRLETIKALQRQGFNLVAIQAILGARGTDPGSDALTGVLQRLAVDSPYLVHALIHETLLHELGHLFGMSEHDLDEFTIGNDPLPGAQPVHRARARSSRATGRHH